MLKMLSVLSLLAAVTALSGCNSTDALIPREDIGNVAFQSPPVTQADLDSMGDAQPVVNSQQIETSGQSTAFSDPATANTNPTQMALAGEEYQDPAGSLDAQAQRLSSGQQMTKRGAVEEQSLVETPEQEQQPEQQQAALTPTTGSGTIRFLPIIGAPVQAVTPLSKQLGSEARAKGLTIKSSADPSSEHILKGYFSALNDGGKTTVIYVWDVLDNAGNRLHRIQGQDSVEATASDPWSVVPAATMQQIAARTMNEYMSWRQSGGI